MNDARIEIPDGLAISPAGHVRVKEPYTARGAADEFENALADAQEEWERTHPAPTAAELAEREAFLAAEADATYGGTAQSDYQIRADALEESRSLALAFETGLGDETAAYLRFAAGDRVVVETDPGQSVDAQVLVASAPGVVSVAAIDVIAAANSEVNLSIVVDSPADGYVESGESGENAGSGKDGESGIGGEGVENATTSDAGAPASLDPDPDPAITGTTLRVFADADSQVNITRVQTLDAECADFDDMGIFASDRARVQVSQTVLGGGNTFTGLAADLRGQAARADIETHYLGRDRQVHDFNYIVRHHGEKTECQLQANGVLAGQSSKTLRGTIDLIRGAKGAEGSENETVLLVDEGVHNKTVPVILCNEDDVAGNHGATIGHIRDEQLFYLASRGLSREEAETMFVSAIMEQAAINAPDAEARAGILRLGERIAPGFTTLFE